MKYFLLLFLFTPAASEASCQESQSQDKEETTLSDHFGWNSKRGGVYVEIGALDGYQGSNTLMLHTCLDWTGVLVEGFKNDRHAKIEVHRPSTGADLICNGNESVIAVASDEILTAVALPVLDLNDTPTIADFIADCCGLSSPVAGTV